MLFDPECIAALKHIIDGTNAEIVVSSSWKNYMNMEQIKRLREKQRVPGLPIGVTPTVSTKIEEDIGAWLTNCPDNVRYVIIDDWPCEQFSAIHRNHLISTNYFDGQTMDLAEKAVQMLN